MQAPPVVGMERTLLELNLNTGCSLQAGQAGVAGEGAGGGVGGAGEALQGWCMQLQAGSWAGSTWAAPRTTTTERECPKGGRAYVSPGSREDMPTDSGRPLITLYPWPSTE